MRAVMRRLIERGQSSPLASLPDSWGAGWIAAVAVPLLLVSLVMTLRARRTRARHVVREADTPGATPATDIPPAASEQPEQAPSLWSVRMRKMGGWTDARPASESEAINAICSGREAMQVTVWARSEQEAVAAADQRRIDLIANGTWCDGQEPIELGPPAGPGTRTRRR